MYNQDVNDNLTNLQYMITLGIDYAEKSLHDLINYGYGLIILETQNFFESYIKFGTSSYYAIFPNDVTEF